MISRAGAGAAGTVGSRRRRPSGFQKPGHFGSWLVDDRLERSANTVWNGNDRSPADGAVGSEWDVDIEEIERDSRSDAMRCDAMRSRRLGSREKLVRLHRVEPWFRRVWN